MKKTFWVLCAIGFLLFSCAGTPSSDDTPILTLNDAIEQSAMKITAELPKGSRVAIVAFESPNGNLSDYIMEELTGALFDAGLEVADRQNLEYVYAELNFQMSGNVSDETAKSVGKFLGASMVITGELVDLRGTYRYRTSAIHVEKAIRASITRLTVQKDSETRRMINALADYKPVARSASYGVSTDKTPQTAGNFFDRGLLFAGKGDWDTAIADFTEAIRLDPNYASAYFQRAYAYRKKDVDRIITDYTQAIRLDPNYTNAYNNRGLAYADKGDYDRAIADFTQALRLDPNLATAYYNRGIAYDDKSDYDKAIMDYTQAIRLDPNYANAYNNRGYAYNNKGNYDRAIADCTQAIRLDPDHVFAYNNRGNAYNNKGDYDQAIMDYTQAISLDPEYGVAYRNRGYVYRGRGDYDKAIADYTQAIRIDPNNVVAYNNRGDVYYMKGDYDQAIADFTQAIRIDPNYAIARENLNLARQARGR